MGGGHIILYYICTEVDKHKQRQGENKELVCLIKAVILWTRSGFRLPSPSGFKSFQNISQSHDSLCKYSF